MATHVIIYEVFRDPTTREPQEVALGEVVSERPTIFIPGRVLISVVKRNTPNGVETTIHARFYDSYNDGSQAAVRGQVEGAKLHLHGDFRADFSGLKFSGEAPEVSPD
ncbi:MAG: hypothetical protein WBP12_01805 [Candidatus Saccharimonas sp.]